MAQTIENIVDPNDSGLSSEMVKIGDLNAYVSRPKDGKNLGTVIVIHENRGLVGHIKDVTRRFAKDGFAAIGVDLMSRIGGSDKWNGSDEATKEIGKITGAMAVEDLTSAVAYMKKTKLRQRQSRRGRLLLGRRTVAQFRDQVQGFERRRGLLWPQSRPARFRRQYPLPGDG
jgi:hypothetical protein